MIWLIGNRGMLGTEIDRVLREGGIEYIGTDREVDIMSPVALDGFLAGLERRGKRPEWIINCSAYTAVDRAEEEPGLCFGINRDGVAGIASVAEKTGAALLHISTDYVFDGTKRTPYLEDDARNPQSVYGASKAEGEKILERTCSRYVILRTAWLYGKAGKNFVSTMLRLMSEKDEVRVVDDQYGSPTYAVDLARAVVTIPASGKKDIWGTYHFTNEGETSWYGFTGEIRRRAIESGVLARAAALVPIRSEDYPSKVRRPAYSVLSKEKFKRTFGYAVRDWKEGLSSYLKEVKAEQENSADERK